MGIHRYEEKYRVGLLRLEKTPISEKNKKLIRDYMQDLAMNLVRQAIYINYRRANGNY